MLQRLGDWHDRLTAAGFAVAAGLVALIAAAFCYEVVVRYFFASPTAWTYDLGAYALCAVIFLSMPELARRGAHIHISLLPDRLPPQRARRLRAATGLVAVLACLLAAWITGNETWRQFEQGVTTMGTYPIPKWWVSILIPYGFLSSAIHFLRRTGEREQMHTIGGAIG
jgi:TRAP-type C4-dicarboxylate transport system permease small subunit